MSSIIRGSDAVDSANIVQKNGTVSDNAAVRFDGLAGVVQNSLVLINDSGQISTPVWVNYTYTFGGQELKTGIGCPADEQINISAIQGTYFNKGAFGYGTGAGGTVTQLTSKGTAVTLNKPSGTITMNNAALAAGATVIFQVSNTLVANIDNILLSGLYSIDSANYRTEATRVATGSFYIKVTNISGGSLSEALIINFSLIKGATA